MSSDFSLPMSAAESLRSSGYRLRHVREVTKHDGSTEIIYVWGIDPPEQFITCQYDEREHVFLSAGHDGKDSPFTDDAGRSISVEVQPKNAVTQLSIELKQSPLSTPCRV